MYYSIKGKGVSSHILLFAVEIKCFFQVFQSHLFFCHPSFWSSKFTLFICFSFILFVYVNHFKRKNLHWANVASCALRLSIVWRVICFSCYDIYLLAIIPSYFSILSLSSLSRGLSYISTHYASSLPAYVRKRSG